MDEVIPGEIDERTRRQGFAQVLGTMDLIAIELDRDANLTFFNDYFLKITGWLRHEVKGANWFERFLPPEHEDLKEIFALALKDVPETWHHENEILARSGKRILVRWNNSPIRNLRGEITGIATIGEDITERRFLERQLLNRVTEERKALCGALHDDLGQSLWGARLLLDSVKSISGESFAGSAADWMQMSAIVDDSIAACRALTRGLAPELKTDLIAALRSLSSGSPISRTQVKFNQTGSAALRLQGEPVDHLFRIAQEAVTNALKHARAPLIEVTLDVQTDRVVLTIVDHGIGIPAAIAKGFGMSLMRYRANALKGELLVQARFPRGTIVSCICPNGTPAAPSVPQQREALAAPQVHSCDVTDILLVEDLDEDAELASRFLRSHFPACSITRVRDGLEALQYVFCEGPFSDRLRSLPHLILLDLNMPRLDGVEMLHTLKSDALTCQIPVLVITGSTEQKELLQGHLVNALSYLPKPISLGAFAEAGAHAGLRFGMISADSSVVR
ncbi:MAG TPA: PAS domain S-box protein [Steroidobacteraceae bacterium]